MTPRFRYWRYTRRLTAVLLAVWLILTFAVVLFADVLNGYIFLGFPLGFYMAAQGSLIGYVVIVWLYARSMDRLDRKQVGSTIETQGHD